MPKLDVFGLKPADRRAETRTFTLDGEEFPLVLTLRVPDAADMAAAAELADQLTRDYVTGSEHRDVAPFPIPEIASPTKTFFLTMAVVYVMQCPENERDLYDPVELAGLSVRQPRNWGAVQQWVNALNQDWTSGLGK